MQFPHRTNALWLSVCLYPSRSQCHPHTISCSQRLPCSIFLIGYTQCYICYMDKKSALLAILLFFCPHFPSLCTIHKCNPLHCIEASVNNQMDYIQVSLTILKWITISFFYNILKWEKKHVFCLSLRNELKWFEVSWQHHLSHGWHSVVADWSRSSRAGHRWIVTLTSPCACRQKIDGNKWMVNRYINESQELDDVSSKKKKN